MHFPYDSFTTLRWLHGPESRPGPLSRRRPRAARAYHGLVGFYRALAPFRFVHGYGVFSGEAPRGWCGPPQHGLSSKTMARITSDCVAMCLHAHQMALITPDCAPFRKCGLRTGVAVEGSADGQVWVECTNHRLPSGLGSGASPSTFAPHQPRLDHALWSALTLACRSAAIWSPLQFWQTRSHFWQTRNETAELSSGMPVQFPQHSDAIRNIYHPTPRSVLTACCPFANGVCHGGGGCSTRTGGLGRSCRYESRGLRSSDFNMLTPYNQPPHKFARKKGPDGGPLLRPIRRASPPPPPPLLPACSLCSRRPAPLQARRGSRGWRSVCSTRAAPARGSCSSSNGAAVSCQSTCGSCPPTTWTTLQQDGPDHLGLWYNALPDHQMALITSDCRPKYVRVRTWWCRFTTPAERAETGQVMAHSRNPCGQSRLQL